MSFIDLRDRISVVTGASRGIGAAIASELAAAGSNVALLDIEEQAVHETAQRVAREAKVTTRAYRLDMREPAEVDAVIRRVATDFGGIDHLVNNAGIQYISSIADFPVDAWNRVTQIDLDGVFFATKAVWPHFVARKRGRIVNIASVQGIIASEFKPAYVAAKHGVVGLARALALETAHDGITVNAVCPGYTETPLLEAAIQRIAARGKSSEDDIRTALAADNPHGRFIQPLEVADVVLRLCADESSSITGQAISISGGEAW